MCVKIFVLACEIVSFCGQPNRSKEVTSRAIDKRNCTTDHFLITVSSCVYWQEHEMNIRYCQWPRNNRAFLTKEQTFDFNFIRRTKLINVNDFDIWHWLNFCFEKRVHRYSKAMKWQRKLSSSFEFFVTYGFHELSQEHVWNLEDHLACWQVTNMSSQWPQSSWTFLVKEKIYKFNPTRGTRLILM